MWPLTPAKRKSYLYLKSLLSWGFSCSPVSLSFVNFLGFDNYKVIASKIHSQSSILKSKGMLSNLVILTYLQSCILHTLTKLPAYCNFDLKSIFST